MADPILVLNGIKRQFESAVGALQILKGIDLVLQPGERVALVGPSGAGKSTLLHIAGLLERPSEGTVKVDTVPASASNDAQRTRLRRSTIGFVYQFHYLLPEFTALGNVAVPQMIAGVGRRAAEARAEALLAEVGLSHRLNHRPAKLSGGEQQRVALARALANKPKLLLADEPTGNLDDQTEANVFDLLLRLVQSQGLAVLMATHNLDLANRMDRVVRLRDGQLYNESR